MKSGAQSLADYELLEMLLFAAIPRRDTKPLAKALIARFGSLIGVFRAPLLALRDAGLSDKAIAIVRFPVIAADRLATAEVRQRPVLTNWEELGKYLEQVSDHYEQNQFRLLYLDNKSCLIADEPAPNISNMTNRHRQIAIRVLALHATSLIGIYVQPVRSAVVLAQAVRALELAMRPLSVGLSDVILLGAGWRSSLRQEGLL